MRCRQVLLLVLVLFPISDTFGDTILVPADQPTIQTGIDAAGTGDTVLVAPGTYLENLDFLGKSIVVTSSHGPEQTVVDGQQAGSVAAFKNDETRDSMLVGFTLTNGTGDPEGPYEPAGGGVYCYGASPSIVGNIISENTAQTGGGIFSYGRPGPRVTDNVIEYNSATNGGGLGFFDHFATIEGNAINYNSAVYAGGGINLNLSSPEPLSNNTIVGNSAASGAGITCAGGHPHMENNWIVANTAVSSGGGISISTAAFPELYRNLIALNSAGYGGGGIEIFGHLTNPEIDSNLIFQNSAPRGGGISCSNWCTPLIVNTTIYGNLATEGGGIFCRRETHSTVVNSILWNNDAPTGSELWLGIPVSTLSVTISYSDLQGGQAAAHVEPDCTLHWGDGMIDVDPLFVDPAQSDFHLTYPSPCRDAGDSGAVTATYDQEGDPRIAWNGTVDMGADEFHTRLYYTGNATPGGAIEGKLVGLPGSTPVGLFFGSGILEEPWPHAWGNFWLAEPWFVVPLVPIPANGVLVMPTTLPVDPPAPWDLPMQGLVGLDPDSLTNLCVLEVR